MKGQLNSVTIEVAVAAVLAGLAWLLVWGFTTAHPEAGLPSSAAAIAAVVVGALALGYGALRRYSQRS